MLTSRNNDLRWILATTVESGPILGVNELCFVSFFCFNFFSVRGTKTFFAFGRENSPVQPLFTLSYTILRSKESGVVLSSNFSCQNSCLRCFLQIFHAKILTRCRLEATHEAIEGSLRMDPGALPFFDWTTFLPKINDL